MRDIELSVGECMTDAELGKRPECERGGDCIAYSEAGTVETVLGDDGLCAECATKEMQRVIDCVTLEDEQRDESAAAIIAEVLQDDRVIVLVRDALRARATARVIRNLPSPIADVAELIARGGK